MSETESALLNHANTLYSSQKNTDLKYDSLIQKYMNENEVEITLTEAKTLFEKACQDWDTLRETLDNTENGADNSFIELFGNQLTKFMNNDEPNNSFTAS